MSFEIFHTSSYTENHLVYDCCVIRTCFLWICVVQLSVWKRFVWNQSQAPKTGSLRHRSSLSAKWKKHLNLQRRGVEQLSTAIMQYSLPGRKWQQDHDVLWNDNTGKDDWPQPFFKFPCHSDVLWFYYTNYPTMRQSLLGTYWLFILREYNVIYQNKTQIIEWCRNES